MKHVAAAPGDDADVAAEGASKLRLATGGHHLELIDRVKAVRDPRDACRIVIGREPVNDEVVRQVPLRAHRDPLSWSGRRFREQLRARRVGRRHAGDEQREIEEVPPVEWNGLHLRLFDGAGNLRARGLERRGFSADGHVRIDAAEGEHDRQLECRSDTKRQRATGVGEALQANHDFVRPHLEERKPESPVLTGGRRGGRVRVRLTCGHRRARHDAALLIRHAAADAGVVDRLLRGGGHRQRAAETRHHTSSVHGRTLRFLSDYGLQASGFGLQGLAFCLGFGIWGLGFT